MLLAQRCVSSFCGPGLKMFTTRLMHAMQFYYSMNCENIPIHRIQQFATLMINLICRALILTMNLLFCMRAKKKIYTGKYYYS